VPLSSALTTASPGTWLFADADPLASCCRILTTRHRHGTGNNCAFGNELASMRRHGAVLLRNLSNPGANVSSSHPGVSDEHKARASG
jgi:hypothetical protein